MNQPSLWPLVRIIALYAVVSAAWILYSDTLVFRWFPLPADQERFHHLKGLGFVAVTSLLLFFVLRREFRRRQELAQSVALANERYELVIRGSGAGLWDWNLTTNESFHSPRLLEMLGYRDAEFPPALPPFAAILHPEDEARVGAALQAHWSQDAPYDIDFRLRTRSGEYRWFRARGQALRDASGQPCRMAGSLVEVTAQKLAEEARRVSEERFKMLARATNDAIWDHHLETDAIWWSDGFFTLFGYTPAEIEPTITSWTTRIHPQDRPRVLERMQRAIATGEKSWSAEYRFRRQDGDWTVVFDRGFVLHDATGKAVRMIGGMTDVTERRRIEDALRESEARLAQAARLARLGHWVADLRTGRAEWSDVMLELYGLTRETFAANLDDIFSRMPPDDRRRYLAARAAALAEGSTLDIEYCAAQVDGAPLWLHTRALVERDAGGTAIRLHGTSLDVTARKQAEEEVRRLNAELEQRVRDRTAQLETSLRELESFSYSVSHDLRTPLRGIAGFAQALEVNCAPQLDETARGFLARISAATRRMGELIDDLLDLSRISRSEMIRQPVDLSALAEAIAAELRQREPQRCVAWEIEPGLTAAGDPRLLRVLLENLLGNAWKFTGKKAEAKIAFRAAGQDAGAQVFAISDDGSGFDMRYAGKLFGAFQRLHAAAEFPGTGIGLATVQRIVHRHGGRVWAQGAVNSGATFSFAL